MLHNGSINSDNNGFTVSIYLVTSRAGTTKHRYTKENQKNKRKKKLFHKRDILLPYAS